MSSNISDRHDNRKYILSSSIFFFFHRHVFLWSPYLIFDYSDQWVISNPPTLIPFFLRPLHLSSLYSSSFTVRTLVLYVLLYTCIRIYVFSHTKYTYICVYMYVCPYKSLSMSMQTCGYKRSTLMSLPLQWGHCFLYES